MLLWQLHVRPEQQVMSFIRDSGLHVSPQRAHQPSERLCMASDNSISLKSSRSTSPFEGHAPAAADDCPTKMATSRSSAAPTTNADVIVVISVGRSVGRSSEKIQ